MPNSTLNILGLDPGLASTGWALIQLKSAHQHPSRPLEIKKISYGVIKTSSQFSLPQRLQILYQELKKIISPVPPQLAAIEAIYFGKNSRSALLVGQAKGVALLALEEKGITCREFTPLEIKIAVCGYGRAAKKQIQQMMQKLLQLKELPRPDHAADALAAAYTAALTWKNDARKPAGKN